MKNNFYLQKQEKYFIDIQIYNQKKILVQKIKYITYNK